MIVLDTSVLSLAFRRRRVMQAEPEPVNVLRELILDDVPLVLPGIVLQEVLSGVRTAVQFSRLTKLLDGFPLLLAERQHHIAAAQIANVCSQRGVATSAVDCLIAALTIATSSALLTVDQDFRRMAPLCDLKLYESGRRLSS